jgi:glyoxalase/bleomycin resistance protein/dioxygenase superfamily protein
MGLSPNAKVLVRPFPDWIVLHPSDRETLTAASKPWFDCSHLVDIHAASVARAEDVTQMGTPSLELPIGMAGLRYAVTQVSLAVRDLDTTMDLYHRAFGWAPWQVFDHVPPIHHNTQLRGHEVDYSLRGAEVYVGSLNFELLQPLQGPNLWSEFIETRGEGIASIATMFHERADGDAVKSAFDALGIKVSMKADIGDHIEYYYLDTQEQFGCLIESGSGHAIDFVRPASVFPNPGAKPRPSPMSGIDYPITQLSHVVRDLDSKVRVFADAFGWGPWKVYENRPIEAATFRGQNSTFDVRFAQAMVGGLNVELVEPLGGASPYQEFLNDKGEGLAGISITLANSDELARAERQFGELGVGVLARGKVRDASAWLILDSERDFKALIALGLGHGYSTTEPDRIID